MKKVSLIGISILATIAVAVTVLFYSCGDRCKHVECLNGGDCSGDGACSCKSGYYGSHCEHKWADDYVGTWSATDVCSYGSSAYTSTITVSSNDGTTIIIENFSGLGASVFVTATVVVTPNIGGNLVSITIPSQTVDYYTVSGSGTLSLDGQTLTITYTIDSLTSDICTGTWVKQ